MLTPMTIMMEQMTPAMLFLSTLQNRWILTVTESVTTPTMTMMVTEYWTLMIPSP